MGYGLLYIYIAMGLTDMAALQNFQLERPLRTVTGTKEKNFTSNAWPATPCQSLVTRLKFHGVAPL